jgi:endonuclease/exonuclease/phosphatase family metal-dependent hydrolase
MSSLDSVTFSQGGALLVTKTEFNNRSDLFIATSHLNRSIEKRMSQAKEAIEKLHHCPNIIFGGDMNWRNSNDSFPLETGWIDAWEHLRPHKPGYTYDTENNPSLKGRKMLCERLDRFLCKLKNFELVDIEIVGKEEIPVVVPSESTVEFQNQSVVVSDHYGLILTVRVI